MGRCRSCRCASRAAAETRADAPTVRERRLPAARSSRSIHTAPPPQRVRRRLRRPRAARVRCEPVSAVATRRLTHVTHPLVQHKLSYLRDASTPTVHFRKLVNELTLLLTYEAT